MPDDALRTNWFHVLVALAERDLHGSAIARDVLAQTEGRLHLWPATLYRTLDDMVAAGLILELAAQERPPDASPRARYYRATARGRDELATETDRLAALVGTARRRLRDASA